MPVFDTLLRRDMPSDNGAGPVGDVDGESCGTCCVTSGLIKRMIMRIIKLVEQGSVVFFIALIVFVLWKGRYF